MTQLEIGLMIVQVIQFVGIWWITSYNRDLLRENKIYLDQSVNKDMEINLLTKANEELTKKTKLSHDVIAVLNDLKNGGALLHVERVDQNDIFFHNGGQYR